jgi:hypothetical protein
MQPAADTQISVNSLCLRCCLQIGLVSVGVTYLDVHYPAHVLPALSATPCYGAQLQWRLQLGAAPMDSGSV